MAARAEALSPGATRAIDIHAPASAVWPWIAQMGPSPRGGAYTYDWIENLLGLDMHSADRVLPEFQHPQVGDTIGYGSNRLRVERVEPEHVLAWRSQDGNWVWTFILTEHAGSTRLVSRNRFRLPTLGSGALVFGLLTWLLLAVLFRGTVAKVVERQAAPAR